MCYPAWRGQCLSRLAGSVFIPLGEARFYPAWRGQCLRRLAGPGFIPLGGPSVYAAWRVQYLRHLAGPVLTPLGGPSIDAAWRAQCLSRLARPVFTPLGGVSVYLAWRAQYLRRLSRLLSVWQAFGQEHGIAVAVKAVVVGDGVLIGAADVVVAGKGANQHQQGRFGKVKVGEKGIDDAEAVAGGDEEVGITAIWHKAAACCCTFQSAQAGRANGNNTASARAAGGDSLHYVLPDS